MTPRLSLIVITLNEAEDLPACLASVRGLADEIVVVDSGSTDGTEEIARSFDAVFKTRAFDGYGAQKQHALQQTSGEWVLSLDADERLSPPLSREIAAALAAAPASCAGFRLPFTNEFLGRPMRHGSLGGQRHLRLVRRERARFTGGRVHEGACVDGAVCDLRQPVHHRPYRDLDEYLEKMRHYTSLAARQAWEDGRRFRVWDHAVLPLEFGKRYLLQRGFLDGTPGLVWAALSAFYAWMKRIKLRELENAPRRRQSVAEHVG